MNFIHDASEPPVLGSAFRVGDNIRPMLQVAEALTKHSKR